MGTSKITLTLLIFFCSRIGTAQTLVLNGTNFIDKTTKEIGKIAQDNNFKILSMEKAGRITSIVYWDSLNSAEHQFVFAPKIHFGRQKCFTYNVNIQGKSIYDEARAGLFAICDEKILDKKRAVQVSGRKKYLWRYYDSSNLGPMYGFKVEKLRRGRNYH